MNIRYKNSVVLLYSDFSVNGQSNSVPSSGIIRNAIKVCTVIIEAIASVSPPNWRERMYAEGAVGVINAIINTAAATPVRPV